MDKKTSNKQKQLDKLTTQYDFIRFRGECFVLTPETDRYERFTHDLFSRLFYTHFPAALVSQIKEVEHVIRTTAPDRTPLDYLIQFGPKNVWNTRTLSLISTAPPHPPVLRSPLTPDPTQRQRVLDYMLELSNGDPSLAWDMLQALAPLFMDKKPAGVIWFVGGGANGKSALINAVYKIIGHHLASMTVSTIEDGRDCPRLNGVIGNICRESSEGRVEDTERYKAIGTHEPFEVHKFHSQETITIQSNFHTVFNANNIPIFSDKTEGARRRTLIVPFPAKFKDDPTFEERTFTPEFLGGLLSLILEATHIIRDNRYQYKFSDATKGAKEDYDSEVNSAEAFLTHLRMNKVRAFSNYNLLRQSYENWCDDNGFVPLGITNLKRVMTQLALAKTATVRVEGVTKRMYFLDDTSTKTELISLDNGMHVGLKRDANETETEEVPLHKQTEIGEDW